MIKSFNYYFLKLYTYIFQRHLNIYIHNPRDKSDIICSEHIHITSVGQNKAQFTPQEVRRAEQARDFTRRMANPSNAIVKSMVKSGRVTSIPFTQMDIDNAEFIWGWSLADISSRASSQPTKLSV